MGLTGDCAATVQEARDFLARETYQLCLNDMRLPDGEGLDLVRHIAANCRDLPVAVITAYAAWTTPSARSRRGPSTTLPSLCPWSSCAP